MAEEKSYTLDLPEGFLGDTFADSDGPKASSTIQPRIQRIADGTISINDFLSSAIASSRAASTTAAKSLCARAP